MNLSTVLEEAQIDFCANLFSWSIFAKNKLFLLSPYILFMAFWRELVFLRQIPSCNTLRAEISHIVIVQFLLKSYSIFPSPPYIALTFHSFCYSIFPSPPYISLTFHSFCYSIFPSPPNISLTFHSFCYSQTKYGNSCMR